MATVMERGEEALVTTVGAAAATPARLSTTLYDLMAALQDAVGPQDNALVVPTMVHLLRSGGCSWRGLSARVVTLQAALGADSMLVRAAARGAVL